MYEWPRFGRDGTPRRLSGPRHTPRLSLATDWFVEFMSAIVARGSHGDFIAIHSYGRQLDNVAASVADINSYIQGVYDKYKLPIWLTETAMATWNGSDCWTNGCYPTEATQAEFASALVQMLEGWMRGFWRDMLVLRLEELHRRI